MLKTLATKKWDIFTQGRKTGTKSNAPSNTEDNMGNLTEVLSALKSLWNQAGQYRHLSDWHDDFNGCVLKEMSSFLFFWFGFSGQQKGLDKRHVYIHIYIGHWACNKQKCFFKGMYHFFKGRNHGNAHRGLTSRLCQQKSRQVGSRYIINVFVCVCCVYYSRAER